MHSQATPPMSAVVGLTNIACEYDLQEANALHKH